MDATGYDMLLEVGGALFALGVLCLCCAAVDALMRWWFRRLERRIIADRVDEWVKRRGLSAEEMAKLREIKARAEKEWPNA